MPASTQAIMLFLSTHFILFMRVTSTDTIVLFYFSSSMSDSVTFVPLTINYFIPSEGNQNDFVFFGHFYQQFCLFVACNIDHVVYCPWQLWVSEHEEFLQRMAVGMVYPSKFGCSNFIHFPLDGFIKSLVFNWRIDGDVSLGFERIADVDADDSLCPLFKFGHFLSWELVSVSCNMDSAIVVNHKLGILVPPASNLKPLFFISYRFSAFDVFLGKIGL